METIFQDKTNLMRKGALFYLFANLFYVWLNWQQFDFHICF